MPANPIPRLWRFSGKPWPDKRRSILCRVYRWLPWAIVPIRLPFGAWWLAQNDYLTNLILNSGYELSETLFVQAYLKEGMTVVDVGAHRGYYTLLASQRVGASGRVIAFEPSMRECQFLQCNLFLNRCGNVVVERIALGGESRKAELYVVRGFASGCNCLVSRDKEYPGRIASVEVRPLDTYLEARSVSKVDFVKLDVEGGELQVLKGAPRLLRQRPRPVILCELIDQLTRAWGYEAREVVLLLQKLGFQWFSLTHFGTCQPMAEMNVPLDGNYVAVPGEKLASLRETGVLR